MRRAAIILAAAAALAAPAAARADSETISMPGKFFDPARSTVVAGDVVTWKNADFATHDVRVGAGKGVVASLIGLPLRAYALRG